MRLVLNLHFLSKLVSFKTTHTHTWYSSGFEVVSMWNWQFYNNYVLGNASQIGLETYQSQGIGIWYTSTVCLLIHRPGFDSWLGQVKYFRPTTMRPNVNNPSYDSSMHQYLPGSHFTWFLYQEIQGRISNWRGCMSQGIGIWYTSTAMR